VFAQFVVDELPVGLVGVVLGAVFSAAMSTLSSSLAASAGALVNDFVLPAVRRTPDSPFALRAVRAATVLFVVLQMAVGISGLGGRDAVVNQVLGIATVTTGVILGLFVLALLRRRSPASSLVGLVGGLLATAAVVWLLPAIGATIAWPWHGVASCAATVLCGATAAQILRPAPA
jgi:Na+/proline symporter